MRFFVYLLAVSICSPHLATGQSRTKQKSKSTAEAVETEADFETIVKEIRAKIDATMKSDDPPRKQEADLKQYFTDFNSAEKKIAIEYKIEEIQPPRIYTGDRYGDIQVIVLRHPTDAHRPIDVQSRVKLQPASFASMQVGDKAIVTGMFYLAAPGMTPAVQNSPVKPALFMRTRFHFTTASQGTPIEREAVLRLLVSNVEFQKADAPAEGGSRRR